MNTFEIFVQEFDEYPRDVDPHNGMVRMESGAERPIRRMMPEAVRPVVMRMADVLPPAAQRDLSGAVAEAAMQRFGEL
jgi:hypothetical protein